MPAAHQELRKEFAAFLERDLQKDLLRFTTAGSVDDGESTLIGRLLHDSKSVYEDQLSAVKKSRINRTAGPIDFSLLTDGLRSEREQGITIDVAYRYFATARRKFIIADTPGHEQYTRNMATGASTADLAIVLIDATKGLLPQTRRHAYIASLLGIPGVLAAVNKMDLVDYGTDILFGLVLAVIGSAFHWKFGAINGPVLTQFLAGGIPGVLVGCALARKVPARKLKLAVATIAILAGLQLIWSGAHTLIVNRAVSATKIAAATTLPARNAD